MSDYDIFTDEYKALPADGPASHPHIVDVEEFKGAEILPPAKVWDAIATMLFKISPDTLKKFLDPTVKEFKLVTKETAHTGFYADLVIWKRGQSVVAGLYFEIKDKNMLEWDNIVQCHISDNGAWSLEHGSFGLYTTRDLESLWKEFIEGRKDRGVIGHTANDKAEYAMGLTNHIICNDRWETKDETLVITCDPETTV